MNEAQTRTELIDKQLKNAGWIKRYIKEEVNSVKSNFKIKEYVLSKGRSDDSGRFIDYLLLAEDNSPIALIEAKKFSASEDKGRAQARTYLKDIEKQIGERIFVFLTNGHNWLFIDRNGVERYVSGPFSQSDLMRRTELHRKRRDPTKITIGRIVDRPRNMIIVKQLMEHIQKGHRLALVSMATGTGKTRVAMSMIDVLLRANIVRNVLFIADRIALTNQAKSAGFREFFTEAVVDLRENPKSFPNGLYVTTVQTLRSGKNKKCYEKFSPGFFDLIIFDEAHRSIYDPNREVHKYFDAIKIGLTATPSNAESRNTFELFGCDGNKPTVEYSYDEAIRDGVLVPYNAQMIDTQVLSLGIEGATLSKELQLQLIKQEEDPKYMMLPGAAFAKVFMDDKTNELIIREFLNRCYKSDEGKPAKTIFFCANVAHAKYIKKLFNKLDPKLSNDVQIIISEIYRYTDEIARFKLDSEPRIALSVGVLDTGVDIPEVCNLVFVKPVFSGIRFWQMLGRGTRNLNSCKHKEWLPNMEKNNFLILDFTLGGHSNVKYHHLKQAKEAKAGIDALTKIFLNRVDLLEKKLDSTQKKFVETKIIDDINALNKDSFIVREKLPIIKKVVSRKFDLKEYVSELRNEIAPLISLNPGKDPSIISFILQVEKLFAYILDGNMEKIYDVKIYVKEKLENILQKDHLEIIQEKKESIIRVLQDVFWDELTFEDVEFMIKELAPLMIYYEKNPKKMIQIDAPDLVLKVEDFKKEVKEDEELRLFLETNPLINKIKSGAGITSNELLELENQLTKIKPGVTIENVQRTQKIDFLVFLRKILDLKQEYDPKELIEREFDAHIMGGNQHYNSEQIKFLQVLKKVFSRTKHIELKDFTVPPLSNERPLDKFQTSELQMIVKECNRIKMK
ncbi:DEAD/DEAH box helicase family protein [Candidatus Micrarchaeota archaeon]|nr:DEAD/DEAH box helicase family protein [Candidatus Micrarchaeota archaeon]